MNHLANLICMKSAGRRGKKNTVESRSKGSASNVNLPIRKAFFRSLEKNFFILYIGNNRNPPITDKTKSVGAGVNFSFIDID